MDFEERVIAVVKALAVGDVVSYADVALEAGFPGAARAVGNVLATTDGLPWWRVIRADGRLPAGKEHLAAPRLRAEGIRLNADGTRLARR